MGIEWSWIFTMMVIITVMVDGGRERGEYFFNAVALKTDFFYMCQVLPVKLSKYNNSKQKGLDNTVHI